VVGDRQPGGRSAQLLRQRLRECVDLTKAVTGRWPELRFPVGEPRRRDARRGADERRCVDRDGSAGLASMIVPVIHPKVYIPNHWDGFSTPCAGFAGFRSRTRTCPHT